MACSVIPPEIASFSTSTIGDTSLHLQWTPKIASPVSHYWYELYIAKNATTEWRSFQFGGDQRSAVVDQLSPLVVYDAKLRSTSYCAHSPFVTLEARTTEIDLDPAVTTLMPSEMLLILMVMLLWWVIVRYFFRTYARVTFVNDLQYGGYARPFAEYDAGTKPTSRQHSASLQSVYYEHPARRKQSTACSQAPAVIVVGHLGGHSATASKVSSFERRINASFSRGTTVDENWRRQSTNTSKSSAGENQANGTPVCRPMGNALQLPNAQRWHSVNQLGNHPSSENALIRSAPIVRWNSERALSVNRQIPDIYVGSPPTRERASMPLGTHPTKASVAQVFLAALPEHRRRAISTYDVHDGVRSALLRAPEEKSPTIRPGGIVARSLVGVAAANAKGMKNSIQGTSVTSDFIDDVPITVVAPSRYSSTIQQLIQSSVNPLTSTVTTLVHAIGPGSTVGTPNNTADATHHTSTLTTQQIKPVRQPAYGYSGAYRTSSMKRKMSALLMGNASEDIRREPKAAPTIRKKLSLIGRQRPTVHTSADLDGGSVTSLSPEHRGSLGHNVRNIPITLQPTQPLNPRKVTPTDTRITMEALVEGREDLSPTPSPHSPAHHDRQAMLKLHGGSPAPRRSDTIRELIDRKWYGGAVMSPMDTSAHTESSCSTAQPQQLPSEPAQVKVAATVRMTSLQKNGECADECLHVHVEEGPTALDSYHIAVDKEFTNKM